MSLRVLLVDDEPLARWRLRSLLAEIDEPRCEVVGEAADAGQALALCGDPDARCDLLLLDIGLPGARNGLQLVAGLHGLARPPSVVFVTAHAEHALRAFELDAADYLTKPVSRERLRSALQRVAQRRRGADAQDAPEAPDTAVLVVHDRGRVLRLPLQEVLYLKAELKYVTLRTVQHSYVLDDPLSELEQRLGDGFLRVHRNALVARAAVRALQRRRDAAGAGDEGQAEHWAVQVMPIGEWLPVSRRQLAAVREALAAGGAGPD
ncbi:MAG: LytTR family DNA-binding domain-containing protein [Rubrivivax sp.]